MTNNENKCEEIFNIIDEYETEKPHYPCWSLCNGEAHEQFENGNEEELKKVLLMIKNYNIISGCYAKAEYFINLASNSLSIFNESKEKEILKNLTSFSLERSY